MKAKIVYIDKWFFGFDKLGEIIYETGLMDKRRDVEFITTSSFKRIVDEDSTIYIYKNPEREDGLWACPGFFVEYGFVNRGVQIYNKNICV